jgi:MFS family permease
MNKLNLLLQRYDRAIWIRFIGIIITTVTSFAVRPFLAIYLYNKTGNIYMIGVILGLAPLMGIFTNLIGGSLTDKYGRKPIMVFSLLVQAFSVMGYVFSSTPWQYCIVSMLNGMASSLFFPAANAQIADIVPENQRAEVFALMHTALNVGAAVGPMLGLMMLKVNPNLVFILSGISLLINCALVHFFIPETFKPNNAQQQSLQADRIRLREHKLLLSFTVFAVPVSLLYAVTESNLPLYLQQNFTNYLSVMTGLLSMNGTLVVIMAVWLAKRTENLYTPYVLMTGYVLFAFVGFGYGLGPVAKSIIVLYLAEFIFTVGECITFPNLQKMLSVMAPPAMRGRYFSIFGTGREIARCIGPLVGGSMLVNFGGLALFWSVSLLLLISGLIMFRLTSKLERVTLPATNDISS